MRLGLGLGVRNSGFVGGYDSATSAFLAATGITSKTESDAVNNLVIRLKSYGLWSKMKAIYPFVSDTVNLLSYSEDFSNTTFWTTPNCIVTPNFATAPNGTTTADKILPNVSSGGFVEMQYTASITSGTTYTYSQYVKANGYNYIQFIGSAAGFGTFYINYDIVNGVETAFSQGTTVGTITRSIESVGNGWFRVSASVPAQATGSYRITLDIIPASNSVRGVAWTSDGVSSVLYWGAQLQTGTLTDYQPIATTPANRFVSQFKYNLKDARDLDAAFRLAFNGTWTYSKQGATPNGVNAYADTYTKISADFTPGSVSFSYYSRSNTSAPTTYTTEIGVGNGTPNLGYYELDIRRTSGNAQTNMSDLFTNYINYTNPDSLGYYIANRNGASVLNLWKNNTKVGSNTTASTFNNLPTNNILIAAAKDGASAIGNYSNRQTAFATLGAGLTDTEATNLYTSVQLFQQELSRYTGVPIVSDANAQAFLDAAVITDQTQANAVNTLVTDLKTYGLWTKMKAIYPFVGGTATTHKWNLKDPRDLDAAYRLAFSGAWTHSSTGALPNGANAYADSFFIPSTALTLNSSHLGFYSRTNNTTGIDDLSAVVVGDTQNMRIIINLTGSLYVDLNSATERVTGANANSTGFYQASRTSSTSLKVYKNNTTFGTNTSANTGTLPIISMYIGAAHRGTGAINYSNRECAFATLGDGLNDTEAANLYTAVQKFETSLNRQI